MLETFPAEGSELGRDGRQAALSLTELRNPGPRPLVSSHAQLDWRLLWGSALPDLGDKQLSATSLLPGPGYRRSGAAGSCSSSIVWVPGGGERPLVLQTLVRLDLVCAWAVPYPYPERAPRPKSLAVQLPSAQLGVCVCPSHQPQVFLFTFAHLFSVPLKFFQAPSGCSRPLCVPGPSRVSERESENV